MQSWDGAQFPNSCQMFLGPIPSIALDAIALHPLSQLFHNRVPHNFRNNTRRSDTLTQAVAPRHKPHLRLPCSPYPNIVPVHKHALHPATQNIVHSTLGGEPARDAHVPEVDLFDAGGAEADLRLAALGEVDDARGELQAPLRRDRLRVAQALEEGRGGGECYRGRDDGAREAAEAHLVDAEDGVAGVGGSVGEGEVC